MFLDAGAAARLARQLSSDRRSSARRQISKTVREFQRVSQRKIVFTFAPQESRKSDGKESAKDEIEDTEDVGDAPPPSLIRIAKLSAPEWFSLLMGTIGAAGAGVAAPAFSLVFARILRVSKYREAYVRSTFAIASRFSVKIAKRCETKSPSGRPSSPTSPSAPAYSNFSRPTSTATPAKR